MVKAEVTREVEVVDDQIGEQFGQVPPGPFVVAQDKGPDLGADAVTEVDEVVDEEFAESANVLVGSGEPEQKRGRRSGHDKKLQQKQKRRAQMQPTEPAWAEVAAQPWSEREVALLREKAALERELARRRELG